MNEQQRRYREDEGRGNDERADRYPYGGDRSAGAREPRHEGAAGARASEEWTPQRWDAGERDERWRGAQGGWRPPSTFAQSGAEWRTPRDESGRFEDTSRRAGFGDSRPRWGSSEGDGGERGRWAGRPRSDDNWGERGFDSGGGSWAGGRPSLTEAASYAGRGPKDYRRSDERIREEVSDRLTDDPRVDASEISVQVQDGLVTLTGTVTDRDQKRRAEDVAEAVGGVKDVNNSLRVERIKIGQEGGTSNVLGIEEAERGRSAGDAATNGQKSGRQSAR